jgi:hypothetical protein
MHTPGCVANKVSQRKRIGIKTLSGISPEEDVKLNSIITRRGKGEKYENAYRPAVACLIFNFCADSPDTGIL